MKKVYRFLWMVSLLWGMVSVPGGGLLYSQESAAPVTVRVASSLSESQLQEIVFITFDNSVRILTLDPRTRDAYVDFTLPGAGTYLCFIHSVTNITIDGKLQNVLGHGALQVAVRGGEVFSLTADFSGFDTRGAFIVGLEATGTIAGSSGTSDRARNGSSPYLGSGERGTAGSSPYLPPFSSRSPAAGTPSSPSSNRPQGAANRAAQGAGIKEERPSSEERRRQERIRELEVQISRMEAELGSLQLLMDSYTQLDNMLLGSGDVGDFFMAPRTYSSGNSLPSPLEGYRQFLQVLKDELDRLRNGG